MSLCSLTNLTIGVLQVLNADFIVAPKKIYGYLGQYYDQYLTNRNERFVLFSRGTHNLLAKKLSP